MTASRRFLGRLDGWIAKHGPPTSVAIARHTPASFARFHPLERYDRWEERYQEMLDELRSLGIEPHEIDAEGAPDRVKTSEDLARWVDAQAPSRGPRPYRLGLHLAGAPGNAHSRAAIGWTMLWLGRDESGTEKD